VHCGNVKTASGWSSLPLGEAVNAAVGEATKLAKAVTGARFSHRMHHEDGANKRLAVTATLRVEDFDVVRAFETRLRIQGATCPTCARQRGLYYEAILQLRASSGRLPADVAADATAVVEDAVAASHGAFITKAEKVRGGVDLYLSSNALAKRIAKTFADEQGADTKSSAKIFGKKLGKDVYRVTYLVRFFTPGARATGGQARSRKGR
jgi:nonsense-mediated mRNA decay protein 3